MILVWWPSNIVNSIYFYFFVYMISRDQNLLLYIKYNWNWMIFCGDMGFNNFQNGGCKPPRVFEISSLCHMTSVAMLFCFHMQNFTEMTIGCWVTAKRRFLLHVSTLTHDIDIEILSVCLKIFDPPLFGQWGTKYCLDNLDR